MSAIPKRWVLDLGEARSYSCRESTKATGFARSFASFRGDRVLPPGQVVCMRTSPRSVSALGTHTPPELDLFAYPPN